MTKLLHTVGAALIAPDSRILIQQRPEGSAYAGFWEFPGGKLEPGEIPQTGLTRELAEELGIVVEQADLSPLIFFSGEYPGLHVVNLIFLCRKWQGDPVPKEKQSMRWVFVSELGSHDFLDKCQPAIAALQKELA